MKTLKIFIVMAIVAIGLICGKSEPSLKGVVKDAVSGNGISKASVTVLLDKKIIEKVKTSSNGYFQIQSLSDGSYSIKTECSGYAPDVRNFSVKLGKASSLIISLSPNLVPNLTQEVACEKSRKKCEESKVAYGSGKAMGRACDALSNYAVTGAVYDYEGYSEPFNTESYDKINENTFKEVVGNPLSTFSIDVDRASYSNVRRFLAQNQKPYKDAVRIEEMINYFDYNYPQPDNGDPFSVTMEMGKCPWNEKNNLLLIGLKGENVSEDKIPASNLVFLIDVSGSMSDQNKLPLLKQSFKYLVNNLRSVDRVAIVVYAGAAGLVLESTPGTEKSKIIAALDLLQAGGSTAGGAGIKLAYKVAKENFITNGNNRVILATDGDFNIGASSDGDMTRLIEDKRKDGVFISILGFGMGNYKDSKMEKIADAGNGNYFYIDNILESKKVFGKELWGTLYTIAKDVKIQVEFNPSKVKAYRLVGYENRILNKEDFNDDKKDAGDIGCGHTVTALYEIVPTGSESVFPSVDPLEYQKSSMVDSKNMLTLKLRYKKPNEDTSKLITHKLKDSEINKKELSENLKFASSVAIFGMLLRESEFKGIATFSQAVALAKDAKGKDEFGYRNDFIKMVETAELLIK
ncbi:MAG: hypothetical protein A2275_14420 [Bacteroidetes bacterium RIFOXYA12_FULL_35_11]|nr:MAG: hypothetical protein A2X01_03340 [Bacteroidetes bacterium GWF2_35_48]OFY76035.1 MAG: hypothetical protein A2275_14420 [Bacteroidetes bacterium RIFOXYA12_FULL_35_11]OFY96965.1 MAG: hypothetical protein A2309_12490 [Bacteroidetes bacterium RIFOXYB2_FULL_35_7]HBX51457.1 hypothetical protein [Bacteroidales bacterium]